MEAHKNNLQSGAESSILDIMIPGLKRIDGELSLQQNLAAINPNFGTGAEEFTQNCGNSTVAYELRRKGYDVEARPGFGMHIEELVTMFDGAAVQRASRLSTTDVASEMIQKVAQDILTWGEGARGAIRGEWVTGGGHLFSLEVREGMVMFDDGQNGKENVKYLDVMKPQSIKYVRLDCLKPNDNIKNAVKSRGA